MRFQTEIIAVTQKDEITLLRVRHINVCENLRGKEFVMSKAFSPQPPSASEKANLEARLDRQRVLEDKLTVLEDELSQMKQCERQIEQQAEI